MLACQQSKIQQFTTGGTPIAVPVIYWHLADHTGDLDLPEVVMAFRKAFDAWTPHMGLQSFASTSDPDQANIMLQFAHPGDADLPEPFGPETLAYAFFPENNYSEIWFDDSELWGEMHTTRRISLFKVAVHEIGHSLGLGHSSKRGDIMEAVYTSDNDMDITSDSIDGLRAIYWDYWKTIDPDYIPTPPDGVGSKGCMVPIVLGSSTLLAHQMYQFFT